MCTPYTRKVLHFRFDRAQPSRPRLTLPPRDTRRSAARLIELKPVVARPSRYVGIDYAEPSKCVRQHDVPTNFGRLEETCHFPLMEREVWRYRTVEDGVWYQLFHFCFDDTDVLRSTQKSPHPLHEQNGNNARSDRTHAFESVTLR